MPPTILEDGTSSDLVVEERAKVSLRCRARGYPPPVVTWRREDGRELNLGTFGGKKLSGASLVSSDSRSFSLTHDPSP